MDQPRHEQLFARGIRRRVEKNACTVVDVVRFLALTCDVKYRLFERRFVGSFRLLLKYLEKFEDNFRTYTFSFHVLF